MEQLTSYAKTIKFNADIPEVFEDLFHPSRYKVYYGGRGGAKSWGFADALLIMGTQKPLRILCCRELQKSITDSVHKLLSDRISALNLDEFYDIQTKTIEGLNGTEFIFNGLKHNAREIKSTEGIDIAWAEEAENISDSSWEILIPTVRKEGSEIWISFNTKQPNDATYKRFILDADDDTIIKKVSYRDNPFFPEVLEKERLKLKQRDEKAYNHVWEGEFDERYGGSIYGKWVAGLKEKGRLRPDIMHDIDFPVYTIWDLGFDDTACIWFYQSSLTEILLIDYYENNGEGIGHYCDVLKGDCQDIDDENNKRRKRYRYGAHYPPQDAGRKVMEANGRSIVEQAWKDHGIKMFIVPETTHANRHAALRKILPQCWINSETCAEGLEALLAYHYEYDDDLKIFKKTPCHDWSSHASTALELLPRVWTGKIITASDMEKQAQVNKFMRLRSQSNLDKIDPYRVKPMRGKL